MRLPVQCWCFNSLMLLWKSSFPLLLCLDLFLLLWPLFLPPRLILLFEPKLLNFCVFDFCLCRAIRLLLDLPFLLLLLPCFSSMPFLLFLLVTSAFFKTIATLKDWPCENFALSTVFFSAFFFCVILKMDVQYMMSKTLYFFLRWSFPFFFFLRLPSLWRDLGFLPKE